MPRALKHIFLAICVFCGALPAQSVLFVGNSFTFRPENTRVGEAADLNTRSAGTGVPAFFQALAVAGGKAPAVSMETAGGMDLAFHHAHKRGLIEKPWDIVVLQDLSTGPLVKGGKPGSFDSFREHVEKLATLLRAQNPEVKIWLYETWARPDLVMGGRFPTLEAMQTQLRAASRQTSRDFALSGWAPVGGTFLAAVERGLADNPATPAVEGPLNLWDTDNYHQSACGAYLSALVFYGALYDADPRALPADNPVARSLNLTPEDSAKLQALAREQLQPAPDDAP